MLSRIFPERIDDHFRGHGAALWLFVPVALMRVGVSLLHIFYADGGAQTISNIPLDTYPPGAAQNVVALFSRMGLEQLLLGLLYALALARYRSMIPLMFALTVAHAAALSAVAFMKPLALAGASGARAPALVLAAVAAAGLVLSLLGNGYDDGGPRRA